MLPVYKSSWCALVGGMTRAGDMRYVRRYDPRTAALAFGIVNAVVAGLIAIYVLLG